MTRQLRIVGMLLFALFGALFVNLNYIQVLQADELADHDRNTRKLIAEYDIRRGSMIAGDGDTELARVEGTEGTLRFLRQYPQADLYAHVTGFHSLVYGRAELESSFNDALVGSAPEAFARNIADLLAGRERVGDDILLTVQPAVQEAARGALGDLRGAVVALHPRTGEVLALWSSPSYDPNRLTTHDSSAAIAYWDELNEHPDNPLRNRAVREWYPPGSTFKVVTAAAALEGGHATPESAYPDPVEQELPQTTATIRNFGRGHCAGGGQITLLQAMIVSCNTTFAQIGLEVGADALIEQAEAFGLNHRIIDQLPSPLDSRIPRELNPPQTAQSAIGQFEVRTTPLQMALIAGAIGNDGLLLEPRLVQLVSDERGNTIAEHGPRELGALIGPESQAISQQTAHILRDMMVAAVEQGTGRGAAIPDVAVAGKTGTAQHGDGPPTVWFIGFAPAEDPRVAVAVVVEDGGGAGEGATGGAVAAPIARAVLEAALAVTGDG